MPVSYDDKQTAKETIRNKNDSENKLKMFKKLKSESENMFNWHQIKIKIASDENRR